MNAPPPTTTIIEKHNTETIVREVEVQQMENKTVINHHHHHHHHHPGTGEPSLTTTHTTVIETEDDGHTGKGVAERGAANPGASPPPASFAQPEALSGEDLIAQLLLAPPSEFVAATSAILLAPPTPFRPDTDTALAPLQRALSSIADIVGADGKKDGGEEHDSANAEDTPMTGSAVSRFHDKGEDAATARNLFSSGIRVSNNINAASSAGGGAAGSAEEEPVDYRTDAEIEVDELLGPEPDRLDAPSATKQHTARKAMLGAEPDLLDAPVSTPGVVQQPALLGELLGVASSAAAAATNAYARRNSPPGTVRKAALHRSLFGGTRTVGNGGSASETDYPETEADTDGEEMPTPLALSRTWPKAAMSTMERCRFLGKQVVALTRAGEWDELVALLQNEAAEMVVTKQILNESGIGKIVGKLRRVSVPAVVTAASDVVEGWRFQVSLEAPTDGDVARTIQETLSANGQSKTKAEPPAKMKRSNTVFKQQATSAAVKPGFSPRRANLNGKTTYVDTAGRSATAKVKGGKAPGTGLGKGTGEGNQKGGGRAVASAASVPEAESAMPDDGAAADGEERSASDQQQRGDFDMPSDSEDSTENLEQQQQHQQHRANWSGKLLLQDGNDAAVEHAERGLEPDLLDVSADQEDGDFADLVGVATPARPTQEELVKQALADADLADADLTDTGMTDDLDSGAEFSSDEEGEVVADANSSLNIVDPFVQCMELISIIKGMYKLKEWDALLELLRKRVANLRCSEDDLRRSDFGRVLGKIVRHAKEDHRVQMAAQEVLTEWQNRIGFHDFRHERETEAERIERIKFEEFMRLPAISLNRKTAAVEPGDILRSEIDIASVRQLKKTKKYEKRIEMRREQTMLGVFTKPLGIDVSIRDAVGSNGIKAFITDIKPDSVAIAAGREGCRVELNDEIISINGINLDSGELTRELLYAKLKKPKVDLILSAFIIGEEDELAVEEEDQQLYRFYRATADDMVSLPNNSF